MDFPSITKPTYPLTETIPDVTIRGQVENLTILTRRRVTRVPKTFALNWNALPAADYETLRAFYIDVNGAESFNWTYPTGEGGTYDGQVFVVRFTGDFNFQLKQHGYYTGSLKLEEV